MNNRIQKLETYSASVLRIGISLVMLWFSFEQLTDAAGWTAYVPDSVVNISGLSAVTLVYINGVFELVFGALLLFGIQTRLAALLLSLHLIDIMFVVGYGEIGVRDFGLAVATFVVFMNGPDGFALEHKPIV